MDTSTRCLISWAKTKVGSGELPVILIAGFTVVDSFTIIRLAERVKLHCKRDVSNGLSTIKLMDLTTKHHLRHARVTVTGNFKHYAAAHCSHSKLATCFGYLNVKRVVVSYQRPTTSS